MPNCVDDDESRRDYGFDCGENFVEQSFQIPISPGGTTGSKTVDAGILNDNLIEDDWTINVDASVDYTEIVGGAISGSHSIALPRQVLTVSDDDTPSDILSGVSFEFILSAPPGRLTPRFDRVTGQNTFADLNRLGKLSENEFDEFFYSGAWYSHRYEFKVESSFVRDYPLYAEVVYGSPGDTATKGVDYRVQYAGEETYPARTDGTLTFAPEVAITRDYEIEETEVFSAVLNIYADVDGVKTLLRSTTEEFTIYDDDAAPIPLSGVEFSMSQTMFRETGDDNKNSSTSDKTVSLGSGRTRLIDGHPGRYANHIPTTYSLTFPGNLSGIFDVDILFGKPGDTAVYGDLVFPANGERTSGPDPNGYDYSIAGTGFSFEVTGKTFFSQNIQFRIVNENVADGDKTLTAIITITHRVGSVNSILILEEQLTIEDDD